VEGGSLSTHVPLEIYSNYAAQGTLTDSRQLRLRTQPYLESNPANAYVTDMGIQNTTDNYFFITAPQNTSTVGDQNTFVISSTSNVGIGTTDPQQPLHVVGNTWITGTLTTSNIVGASPVTISSDIVMASGFTLTAAAIEPPSGAESNLNITGTITTSNITHGTELTVTSNLLMGSDKTLTTSNITHETELTVTSNLLMGSDKTLTTSNITHETELTVTSNLLMGSDKTLTTSNIFHETELTVSSNLLMGSDKTLTTSNIVAHANENLLISSNLEVGTSNLFVNTANGNVGIGTNAPDAKLDVVGKVIIDDGSYSAPGNGTTGSAGTRLVLWPGDADNTPYALGIDGGTLWYGSPSTHRWYVGTSEKMRITNTGNVGIGQASPNAKLHVAYQSTTGFANGTIRIGNYINTDTYDDNIYSILWSDQIGMGPYSSGKGIWSRQGLGIHVDESEEFSIKSSSWTNLFGVQGGSGDVYAKGRIFNNNPVFHAYKSAGADSTATGIYNVFTSVYINRGNHYYTSGGNIGKFIAPVAGVYYFSANMLQRYRTAAGPAELTFYKNGVNASIRSFGYTYVTSTSDHDNLHIEAMLSLAADDYVQVGVKALSAGTDIYYGESLANFRGFLIG